MFGALRLSPPPVPSTCPLRVPPLRAPSACPLAPPCRLATVLSFRLKQLMVLGKRVTSHHPAVRREASGAPAGSCHGDAAPSLGQSWAAFSRGVCGVRSGGTGGQGTHRASRGRGAQQGCPASRVTCLRRRAQSGRARPSPLLPRSPRPPGLSTVHPRGRRRVKGTP